MARVGLKGGDALGIVRSAGGLAWASASVANTASKLRAASVMRCVIRFDDRNACVVPAANPSGDGQRLVEQLVLRHRSVD
jgi:hypothetical protein